MEYFAYIDAGTGSMFIQAILGLFLAASVVLRSYWARILGKLKPASRSSKDV